MTDLDNLRRRADIRRGLEMILDRDDFIVEGLYAHFVAVQKRQPEGDEFPEYVHLISSTHEWLELWELFSSSSPLTDEEKEARLRRVAPRMAVPTAAPLSTSQVARAGQPSCSGPATTKRASTRTCPSPTVDRPALRGPRRDAGTSTEYLRKLVRRFGRPPR